MQAIKQHQSAATATAGSGKARAGAVSVSVVVSVGNGWWAVIGGGAWLPGSGCSAVRAVQNVGTGKSIFNHLSGIISALCQNNLRAFDSRQPPLVHTPPRPLFCCPALAVVAPQPDC